MQMKNRKTPLFIQQVQFELKLNKRLPVKCNSSITAAQQQRFYTSRYAKFQNAQKPLRYENRYSEQNILPSIRKQQNTINKKMSIVAPVEIPTLQKSQPKRKIKHLRNKSEKYLSQIQKLKETNSYQKMYFISNLCLEHNCISPPLVDECVEEQNRTKQESKDKKERRIVNRKTIENAPQQLITKKINQQQKNFWNKNEYKIDYQNLQKKRKKQSKQQKMIQQDQKLYAIEGWNMPSVYKKSYYDDF